MTQHFNQLIMRSQPHSQLTSKLVAFAATNHRVHLLDCSRIYLDPTGTHVSPQLMPGGLHPSKAGEDAPPRACNSRRPSLLYCDLNLH